MVAVAAIPARTRGQSSARERAHGRSLCTSRRRGDGYDAAMQTKTLTIAFALVGLGACSEGSGDGSQAVFTLRGAGDLSAVSAPGATPRANSGLSPELFNVKVHGFSVSASGDCSDPITLLDDADPPLTDMMDNPTIWEGEVPDGTYPCVIMEISDILRLSPTESSDDGQCVQGELAIQDVCHGDDDDGFRRLDGSVGDCADEEQRVALYLSTWSTRQESTNPFWPPTEDGDTTAGLELDGELVVDGDTIGTFVIDATGQVQSAGDHCEVLPPTFAFL